MHVAAHCYYMVVIDLMIRWCQIGGEPSTLSTESSTNDHVADNPEITSEE